MAPHPGGYFWNDDRVEQLKVLWDEGLSCSQIARKLGGITRNAVIGKVTRLNLAKRATQTPRRTWSYKRVPSRIEAPYVPPPVVEHPPLVLADGARVTVMTVNDRMCRWPIGDPRDADFHFCGNAPERGPYCEAHARKAYQPKGKQQEAEAA